MGRMIYVLKDNLGNYCNHNSIKKWNSKTWIYVSFKSFSQECRGYLSLERAEGALEEIKSRSVSMGLDASFKVAGVKLSDLVREHRCFVGENMVLVEKLV